MTSPVVFTQLPREQSRHQMVVQRLRDAIAEGHLAIGERLPSERELCEQLGVSRTIVREAMRVLASQGILTVRQGRHAVVATDLSTAYLRPMRQLIEETKRQTFDDVLDARLIIEVASAERAAQFATSADLVAMAEALEAMRGGSSPDYPAGHNPHSLFHLAIAEASHNLILARMLEPLIESHIANDPGRSPALKGAVDASLLPLGYEAHARILRPIRDRRAAAARRAMHEHLSTTIQRHPGLRR
jgi:DNA-binding FadR family transcriptional regulator